MKRPLRLLKSNGLSIHKIITVYPMHDFVSYSIKLVFEIWSYCNPTGRCDVLPSVHLGLLYTQAIGELGESWINTVLPTYFITDHKFRWLQQLLHAECVNIVWHIDVHAQRSPNLSIQVVAFTWWRHQMETFSASLALCAGNKPATGEFP